MSDPDCVSTQSPDAMHARSEHGAINQFKFDLGDKTRLVFFLMATVLALAICALVWCLVEIHWYRVEERLHQDADVHLQSDYFAPLGARVDGLSRDLQALEIRMEVRQECRKH